MLTPENVRKIATRTLPEDWKFEPHDDEGGFLYCGGWVMGWVFYDSGRVILYGEANTLANKELVADFETALKEKLADS